MQEKGGGLKDDRTLHGSCVYSSHLYHLVLHVLMGTLHTRAMQSRIILQGPLGEVRGGAIGGKMTGDFGEQGKVVMVPWDFIEKLARLKITRKLKGILLTRI